MENLARGLKLNHLPGGFAELLRLNGTSTRGSGGTAQAISSPAGRKCQREIYGSSQRRLKRFSAEQSAPADRQIILSKRLLDTGVFNVLL